MSAPSVDNENRQDEWNWIMDNISSPKKTPLKKILCNKYSPSPINTPVRNTGRSPNRKAPARSASCAPKPSIPLPPSTVLNPIADASAIMTEDSKLVYADNMRKLIITARKQINDLTDEVANLRLKLEASGVVQCPSCCNVFRERQHRQLPRYIKVYRGKLMIELEFSDLDRLTEWLTLNSLDTDADGLSTFERPAPAKEDLTTTGSLLPALAKEAPPPATVDTEKTEAPGKVRISLMSTKPKPVAAASQTVSKVVSVEKDNKAIETEERVGSSEQKAAEVSTSPIPRRSSRRSKKMTPVPTPEQPEPVEAEKEDETRGTGRLQKNDSVNEVPPPVPNDDVIIGEPGPTQQQQQPSSPSQCQAVPSIINRKVPRDPRLSRADATSQSSKKSPFSLKDPRGAPEAADCPLNEKFPSNERVVTRGGAARKPLIQQRDQEATTVPRPTSVVPIDCEAVNTKEYSLSQPNVDRFDTFAGDEVFGQVPGAGGGMNTSARTPIHSSFNVIDYGATAQSPRTCSRSSRQNSQSFVDNVGFLSQVPSSALPSYINEEERERYDFPLGDLIPVDIPMDVIRQHDRRYALRQPIMCVPEQLDIPLMTYTMTTVGTASPMDPRLPIYGDAVGSRPSSRLQHVVQMTGRQQDISPPTPSRRQSSASRASNASAGSAHSPSELEWGNRMACEEFENQLYRNNVGRAPSEDSNASRFQLDYQKRSGERLRSRGEDRERENERMRGTRGGEPIVRERESHSRVRQERGDAREREQLDRRRSGSCYRRSGNGNYRSISPLRDHISSAVNARDHGRARECRQPREPRSERRGSESNGNSEPLGVRRHAVADPQSPPTRPDVIGRWGGRDRRPRALRHDNKRSRDSYLQPVPVSTASAPLLPSSTSHAGESMDSSRREPRSRDSGRHSFAATTSQSPPPPPSSQRYRETFKSSERESRHRSHRSSASARSSSRSACGDARAIADSHSATRLRNTTTTSHRRDAPLSSSETSSVASQCPSHSDLRDRKRPPSLASSYASSSVSKVKRPRRDQERPCSLSSNITIRSSSQLRGDLEAIPVLMTGESVEMDETFRQETDTESEIPTDSRPLLIDYDSRSEIGSTPKSSSSSRTMRNANGATFASPPLDSFTPSSVNSTPRQALKPDRHSPSLPKTIERNGAVDDLEDGELNSGSELGDPRDETTLTLLDSGSPLRSRSRNSESETTESTLHPLIERPAIVVERSPDHASVPSTTAATVSNQSDSRIEEQRKGAESTRKDTLPQVAVESTPAVAADPSLLGRPSCSQGSSVSTADSMHGMAMSSSSSSSSSCPSTQSPSECGAGDEPSVSQPQQDDQMDHQAIDCVFIDENAQQPVSSSIPPTTRRADNRELFGSLSSIESADNDENDDEEGETVKTVEGARKTREADEDDGRDGEETAGVVAKKADVLEENELAEHPPVPVREREHLEDEVIDEEEEEEAYDELEEIDESGESEDEDVDDMGEQPSGSNGPSVSVAKHRSSTIVGREYAQKRGEEVYCQEMGRKAAGMEEDGESSGYDDEEEEGEDEEESGDDEEESGDDEEESGDDEMTFGEVVANEDDVLSDNFEIESDQETMD